MFIILFMHICEVSPTINSDPEASQMVSPKFVGSWEIADVRIVCVWSADCVLYSSVSGGDG